MLEEGCRSEWSDGERLKEGEGERLKEGEREKDGGSVKESSWRECEGVKFEEVNEKSEERGGKLVIRETL